MLFNSLPFLYGFLPTVYVFFWLLKTRQGRFACLAVSGYLFYSFWDPRFCLLMAFSTLVSYLAGLGFLRWSDPRRRKLLLIVPITIDLGVLGFFKYTGFALDSAGRLASALGFDLPLPALQIVLPVGISFYTFKSMSYAIDVYRGEARPMRNFVDFCCFEAFFPDLVAGPIVRYSAIEQQMRHRTHTMEKFARGIAFSPWGWAKKSSSPTPWATSPTAPSPPPACTGMTRGTAWSPTPSKSTSISPAIPTWPAAWR